MDVRVKWARNTAEVMRDDSAFWENVEVTTNDDQITLHRDGEIVASFGQHDVDVFVTESE